MMAIGSMKTETQKQSEVSSLRQEAAKPSKFASTKKKPEVGTKQRGIDDTKTIEAITSKTGSETTNPTISLTKAGMAEQDVNENSLDEHEFEKKKKLAHKAKELLLHLYSDEYLPRKCGVYFDDENSGSENELCEDDIIDCEIKALKMFRHKRTNDYSRAKRQRAPLKEQKFEEFCRRYETPSNIIAQKGNRKSLRVKFDRCTKQITKNINRKDHTERRKVNIEKRLARWGIKRRGIPIPGNYTGDETSKRAGKYEINQGNVPKEMQDMLPFLMALQDREVTPEDYEFLLRLDDLIPKKTASETCLRQLREEVVDESHADEICGICMDNYRSGEMRKILPCGHVFHNNCIEQWLSQSSTKCPLDGLDVW